MKVLESWGITFCAFLLEMYIVLPFQLLAFFINRVVMSRLTLILRVFDRCRAAVLSGGVPGLFFG